MAEEGNGRGATASGEAVDLIALGRAWKPPHPMPDTSSEVAEVLATPPWWAPRALIYILVGFIAVALVWARFSTMDTLAEGRGALIPEGNVRPVQAEQTGAVQYVLAREGDRVEKDQALVQLDPTEPRARLAKLREELASSQEQLQRLHAARATSVERLEQENRVSQIESAVVSAELALKHTTLAAPMAGTVMTLDVRGPGAVVQAGQRVAALAPVGAALVAEARMPNRDMGLVRPGLTVRLKLDAFPYQDYGTVAGKVIEVAPDAEVDTQGGSYYRVTIAPEKTSLTAGGKTYPLRPGLTLNAEIITGQKTILALLFPPFRNATK